MTKEPQDPRRIVDAKIEATLIVQHTFEFIQNCIANIRDDEELIILMPIHIVADILRALKIANHEMYNAKDIREPTSIFGIKVIATDSVDVATPTFTRSIKRFEVHKIAESSL